MVEKIFLKEINMSYTTYEVQLQRVVNDSRIGPTGLKIVVQAPSSTSAKHMAESQARGYKAISCNRK